MFRRNPAPQQPALLSDVNTLPEKRRVRLEMSWAGTFRREFFNRLNEEAFADLYAVVPSRPNVPVNVLVGLEALKAGHGWSDEELYDHFLYDLQVRFAVGYDNLTGGDFELRTLYNFRRRLSEYNLAHGTNLLQVAFCDITDQQLTALALHTGQQRMDSTQLASNILQQSRLQLTVEAIQRLYRLLSDTDKVTYSELVAPYVGETAGHYVHRVNGYTAELSQLAAVGQTLHQLLQRMAADYGNAPAYQVATRLFGEQYRLVEDAVQAKANKEIRASSLQSLDDLEATYREKNGVGYQGYVANASETCDPANPVQLITSAAVAPNTMEDSRLLCAAVPELKARMAVTDLHADAAYASPEGDVVLREHQVTLHQTGIRGRPPAADKLHLSDFVIEQNAEGEPVGLTCPQGQRVAVERSRRSQRFAAPFDTAKCHDCPLYQAGQCPPQPDPRRRSLYLTFNQVEVDRAQRLRRARQRSAAAPNLRAAVEATMRSIKHPFRAGKLPGRGLFRITCLVVGAAAMTNVRRIQRYASRKRPANGTRSRNRAAAADPVAVWAHGALQIITRWVVGLLPIPTGPVRSA